MSKKISTYGQLAAIDDDFKKTKLYNPGVYLLLEKKINEFYQANGLRLQSLKKSMEALCEEHVIKVDGKFQVTEDGKHWLFKTEADSDTYLIEKQALYAQQFEMVY